MTSLQSLQGHNILEQTKVCGFCPGTRCQCNSQIQQCMSTVHTQALLNYHTPRHSLTYYKSVLTLYSSNKQCDILSGSFILKFHLITAVLNVLNQTVISFITANVLNHIVLSFITTNQAVMSFNQTVMSLITSILY